MSVSDFVRVCQESHSWGKKYSRIITEITFSVVQVRLYGRAAQAVHIAQCAKMCAAQPARVHMMQRHGPACERDR
jgi:hypothetical protein